MSSTLKYIDVDYSFYLGEDYKKTHRKIKRTSTIVSNHVTWLDTVILIKNISPAFAPSAEFKNVPLFHTLIEALDSIYIPRGGSEESRQNVLNTIVERQTLIEETGKYSPFLVFAEGGTTNGTGIMKFKKGAFWGEKTIRPMYLKYHSKTISPAFDTMEFLPLVILHLSWNCFTCEVCVLPDFQPNEYLFDTHADQGKERWEVYAWAIRDILCKKGGFEECNQTLRQKLQYEAYMQQKPGAVVPTLEVRDPAHDNLLNPNNQQNTICSPNANSSMIIKIDEEKNLPRELPMTEIELKKVLNNNSSEINESEMRDVASEKANIQQIE